MNIDERLEKLAERHEALTQTVEHLALQGELQNKRLDRLDDQMEKLGSRIERLVGVAEGLLQVVASHERRLAGLEGIS